MTITFYSDPSRTVVQFGTLSTTTIPCFELDYYYFTIYDYQLFLFIYFAQQGISYSQLRINTEIAVYSQRVGVCIPDLVVFLEELATVMQEAKRSLVLLDMPPLLLVVEVVSPNQQFDIAHYKENRDYRYERYCSVTIKRSEYAVWGIMEY